MKTLSDSHDIQLYPLGRRMEVRHIQGAEGHDGSEQAGRQGT